jgi:pyrroline-5-carboxylate reductase
MLRAGAAEPERLKATDPDAARRGLLASRLGHEVFCDNKRLVSESEVVVLSVKPQIVPVVGAEIAGQLGPEHLVLSIAAGVTLSLLRDLLGTDRLVRVMPNTPALVGEGASVYCTADGATDEDAAIVEEMLSAVGTFVFVDEEHMDAVTGLSGSGPAYVYAVIDALRQGGVEVGLPEEVAAALAAQTVIGAAKMVMQTGKDPRELIEQVTTPGGTTVEGLAVLEQGGMRETLVAAVAAATQRSRSLGEEP